MDHETVEILMSFLLREDIRPLFYAEIREEHAKLMLEHVKPDSPPSCLYFIEVAAIDNVCEQWGFLKGRYVEQQFVAMDPVNDVSTKEFLLRYRAYRISLCWPDTIALHRPRRSPAPPIAAAHGLGRS
jgi:hypothetical protein